MKIFFVCDLSSIHARKWVRYFVTKGYEVSVFSTSKAGEGFQGAEVYSDPEASHAGTVRRASVLSRLAATVLPLSMAMERAFIARKKRALLNNADRLAPLVAGHIRRIRPDVVHGLRLPNEGFIAAAAAGERPLVLSTWGNDLIYFAAEDAAFRIRTQQALARCGFLITDCSRDRQLAATLGFDASRPSLIIPGAGGIPASELERGHTKLMQRGEYFSTLKNENEGPLFLSLRGFGSQDIDNVPLLRACRMLVKQRQKFTLVLVGKVGTHRYCRLVHLARRYGIERHVVLREELPYDEVADALASADFFISVAHHDGVPNSMLEAMAYGAVPVMSNLDSIREWIRDGENGFLFNPRDPHAIAATMLRALGAVGETAPMRAHNHRLVSERASYEANLERVDQELRHWLSSLSLKNRR